MKEWPLDPDERRVAHAMALVADAELRQSGSHDNTKVAMGAGYTAIEPQFAPPDATGLPSLDPMHINSLDA